MKKSIILILVLCAWSLLVSAQITQKEANSIARQYVQSEIGQSLTLYIHKSEPHVDGVTITTSQDETFRAKYACWAYCVNDVDGDPGMLRSYIYIFVKASNGSVLEVTTSEDNSSMDDWELLGDDTGIDIYNETTFYPNPVNDIVYIPCNSPTLIEIYDLQGKCVFSEQVFCEKQYQLSLSFLKSGVYMLHNGNQTHRIVKQ